MDEVMGFYAKRGDKWVMTEVQKLKVGDVISQYPTGERNATVITAPYKNSRGDWAVQAEDNYLSVQVGTTTTESNRK